MSMATALIPLTREPARIAAQGRFSLPGLGWYTIGRDALAEVLPRIKATPDVLTVDIETAGKEGRARYDTKAVTLGDVDDAWIFDPRDPYQFEMLRDVINGGNQQLVMHNSPFDSPALYLNGIMDMPTVKRVADTLIWARLAEPDEKTRKSLTDAANRYLGLKLTDPLKDLLKAIGLSKQRWYAEKDLDTPAYRIMAASDAILTRRIIKPVRQAAYNRLTSGHPFARNGVKGDDAWSLVDREQIMNRQFLARTFRGFLVDPEYLDKYRHDVEMELREAERILDELSIRPGNSADLTSWLEREGHLPAKYPRTAKTKQPSGDKKNLALLAHPVAKTFVFQKEQTHILRDYLDKTLDNADVNGRIHPAANLLAAQTGRMSYSGDAPVHQFSGPARGIILADDHEEAARLRTHPVADEHGDALPCNCETVKGMVSIDWSQIEPVITANIAGDYQAVKYYEDGNKFYNALVEFGGIKYKDAKTTLLAQLYGEGKEKLSNDLQLSMEETEEIINQIWTVLPGTRKLVDKAYKGGKLQRIATDHKMVFTLSGRIVPIPAGWWPCWEGHENQDQINACRRCNGRGLSYSVAAHKGVNYFVQGSAYDLLAETIVKAIEAGYGDAIYLAMHDELVVDAEARHDIQKLMQTPPERLVMLARRTPVLRTDMAHLGERWAAA